MTKTIFSNTRRTLLITFLVINNICSGSDNIITNDQKKLIIDEQLHLAEGLTMRGYYEQAISEYKDIIKRFPNSVLIQEAWAQLAYAQAKEGKNSDALKSYDTFLKNYPLSPIYTAVKINYARLLGTLKNKEKVDRGIEILTEIINDENSSIHLKEAASFYLAEIFHNTDKKEKAVEIYTELSDKALNKKYIYRVYALLKIAEKLIKEDNSEAAVNIYNEIIDNPNLADEVIIDAYHDLALLYTNKKQYEQAADIYERLSKQFPKTEQGKQAVYHKLECLYFAKKYELVIAQIDELLKSSFIHDKEKLYFIRACSLQQQTFYSAAYKSFKKVLEMSQNQEFYQQSALQSINCLLEENEIEKTAELAIKFVNDKQLTDENKKIIIETTAQHFDNVTTCIAFWEKLVTTALNRELVSWGKYRLALCYVKNNQITNALAAFEEVLKSKNKELHPYALNGIISCQLLLEDYDKAAKSLDKVISDYSTSSVFPSALLTKVELCIRKQEFDEAYNILNSHNKILMESKDWPKAVYYLGCINYVKENWKEAEKNFIEISSNPTLAKTELSEANLYLALINIKKGNDKEAEKILLPLINEDNIMKYCSQDILLKLGSFFLKTKNYSQAQKCFYKVLDSTKDNLTMQTAYSGIAKSCCEQNDFDNAIKYYKKAAFIKPATINTNTELANLANALIKSNKDEEALIMFQRILESPTDSKSTIEARMGMARVLSKQPDRILRANRYAMSVFILSKDQELCREAMLLSIKLSIQANNISEAENTWNEYCTSFPDYINKEEAVKIKKLLLKHLAK